MSSIRRHVHIAAPSRAVWNAVTTSKGLASWWVDSARVDGRQGGRLVLNWTDDDGKEVEAWGMFHELRPTAQVEVLFDRVGTSPLRGCRLGPAWLATSNTSPPKRRATLRWGVSR
jgi:hypothetical protein